MTQQKAVLSQDQLEAEERASQILSSGFLVTMADDIEMAKAGKFKGIQSVPVVFAVSKPLAKEEIKPKENVQTSTEAEKLEAAKKFAEDLKKKKEEDAAAIEEIKRKLEEEKKRADKGKDQKLSHQKQEEELKRNAIIEQVEKQKAEQEAEKAKKEQEAKLKAIEDEKKAAEEEKKRREAERQKQEELKKIEEEKKKREQESERLIQEENRKKKEEERIKKELAEKEQARKREEEQKKVLEERQKEDSIGSLTEKKASLSFKLREFPAMKRPIEAKKEILLKQKESLSKSVDSLIREEEEYFIKKQEIEAKELASVAFDERHTTEKERWGVEEKLRMVEKEKWIQEGKLKETESLIDQIEKGLLDLNSKELEIKKQLDDVLWKIKEIELKEEEARNRKIISQIEQNIAQINKDKEAYLSAKIKLESKLSEITKNEKVLENKISEIIIKEKAAIDANEEKELEKQRWQIEDERQKTEQERWIFESKQKTVFNKIDEFDRIIKEQNEKIDKIKIRNEEIKRIISNNGKPDLPIKVFKKPEIKVEAKAEPEAKAIIEDEKSVIEKAKEAAQKLSAQKIEEAPKEEKKETPILVVKKPQSSTILEARDEISEEKEDAERRREQEIIERAKELKILEEEKKIVEEIKRIARQNEIKEKIASIQDKAKKVHKEMNETAKGPMEKESILKKISNLSAKEEAEREDFLERVAGNGQDINTEAKEKTQEVVFRPIIRKPSFLEKFVWRIFIIALIAAIGVVGFFAWKFISSGSFFNKISQVNESINNNETPNPEPISTTTEENENEYIEEPATTTQGLEEPAIDFAQFDETRIIAFNDVSEIPGLFESILGEQENADTLVRILAQDSNTQTYLGEQEILQSLGFEFDEEVLNYLAQEGNILVYYSNKGPRIAFVFKITNKDLISDSMKLWEESLTSDFAPILNLEASPSIAINFSGKFSQTQNNGGTLHYIDADKPAVDIGICYSIKNDYLIMSGGGSAAVKLLQIIP